MPRKHLPALAFTAAVAAAGTLTYAALTPGSQLFGRTLIAGHDPDQLALTFDDGPNPAITPQLLDLLAEHNVRATFFLIGAYVRQQPALTRRLAAAGHVVGNHTMTHPWLAWQSSARIRAELTGCNHAIEDATGQPVRLFRPPHGARRPAVLEIARDLGLTTVQWNLIANDWQPDPAATILARLERGIARNRRRGRASNIVLHDGSQHTPIANRLATVGATRQLLNLHASTARFVTPDAWLQAPAQPPSSTMVF